MFACGGARRKKPVPSVSFKQSQVQPVTVPAQVITPNHGVSHGKPSPSAREVRQSRIFIQTDEGDQDEAYSRKINTLTQCLDEKAEENISLFMELRALEKNIAEHEKHVEVNKGFRLIAEELRTMIQQRDKALNRLKIETRIESIELRENQKRKEEYERRFCCLTACVESMAQENMELAQCLILLQSRSMAPMHPKLNSLRETRLLEDRLIEVTFAQEYERAVNECTSLESELQRYQTFTDEFEIRVQTQDLRMEQFNFRLVDAISAKFSLKESCDLYGAKLKSLDREISECIEFERLRRQEAEYTVKRLQKKVLELQFYLEEQDDDDSCTEDDA